MDTIDKFKIQFIVSIQTICLNNLRERIWLYDTINCSIFLYVGGPMIYDLGDPKLA